jgi:hypothetical protein
VVVLPKQQSGFSARAEACDHQGGSQSHPLHYGLLLEKSFFRCWAARNSRFCPDTRPVRHVMESVSGPHVAGNTAGLFVQPPARGFAERSGSVWRRRSSSGHADCADSAG